MAGKTNRKVKYFWINNHLQNLKFTQNFFVYTSFAFI
jgi:hypothetical protein